MSTRHPRLAGGGLFVALVTGLVLTMADSHAQDKDKLGLDKVPKPVMDALHSKFPKPEVTQWTKETEGGHIVYDFELKYQGRKCEMDIREDGTILNIEREIPAKDLPKAVIRAVETKYPKAALQEIMEIKVPKGQVEEVEGYEVVIVTVDKRTVELGLAPDGKIIEETELKKEEKK